MNKKELKMDNKVIYIIPVQDKPVKIIFEGLPCPICSEIRCSHAKSSLEDLVYSITCTNTNGCTKI